MRFKKNKKSINPRYFLLEQSDNRKMVDGDGNVLQYDDPVKFNKEDWVLNSYELDDDGKVEIKRDTKYAGETMDIEPIHLTQNL